MSKRGTILLAVGMLILGVLLGFVAGGVMTGFLARRALLGRAAVGRFAPGYFGAPRFQPRGMPFYAPRGQSRRAPFNGRRGTMRRAPNSAIFANGVQVTSLESNSPADKAGLKAGDVITAVAGTKIDQSHPFPSLIQSHKPGEKIDLSVMRSNQNLTITVELGASPQNSNTAHLGIRYGPAPGSRGRFR